MNELPLKPQLNIPVVNGQSFFHGSLFSGIGGFDLAAEWAGWQNAFHCEWNEFGQKILKHYWPKAISYGDITKTDFTIHRGTIDVLTGGFPCQPYSSAGKRLGKEDERHLWPEMLRAIREISPSYIVGENVYGLVNWNGGLVFEEVQADLEAEGYEILPVILPACAVGAPHRRERVWFVAYSNKCTTRPSRTGGETESYRSYNNDEQGCRGEQTEQHNGYGNVCGVNTDTGLFGQAERQKQSMGIEQLCEKRNATNTCNEGFQRNKRYSKDEGENSKRGKSTPGTISQFYRSTNFEQFPTKPPICSGNDGFSSGLDGITFPKWRNESIKGYGNAIVPQVAYQIFNAINLHAASLA